MADTGAFQELVASLATMIFNVLQDLNADLTLLGRRDLDILNDERLG
jgi:hypothetical protein